MQTDPSSNGPTSHRLRITFAKSGPITYSSHLDLARAWERSLRRARVPLAYSQGFNPRPKLQLAAALPLGYTGEAELLDIWLERPMPVGDLARALVPVLPAGLSMKQVIEVEPKGPALQTRVASAEYRVTIGRRPEPASDWDGTPEQVEARIAEVLAQEELPHERRGRGYDLRPLIEGLWIEGASRDEVVLGMQLAAREGATARPDAVVEVLGLKTAFARYQRRRLITREG